MDKKKNISLNINDIKITKLFIEWVIIVIFFIFSLMSSTTLLISLIAMLSLLRQKEIGCIKILNIITLRTIINPGVAVDIDVYQEFKWIIILGCSIYLLFSYFKLENKHQKKINKLIKPIILFAIYNLVVSLFFSSLPVVASFKVLSYIIVFLGIMIGIGYTHEKVDWVSWMTTMLTLVLVSSLPLIKFPVGYLRNGHAFQGITNQPNMFGIVISIFVAILFSKIQLSGDKIRFQYFLVAVSTYVVYLSKARTSLITILFLIFFYIFVANTRDTYKILYLNVIGILTIIFFYLDNAMKDLLKSFLAKEQEYILYSRVTQVNNLVDNFLSNPLFGSGFGVPVLPFKSYEFSFDYVVEPGNLILAVLSYSGIIGFILFSCYMFKIFWINKKEFKNVGFLFITPILISMGEMVFFSSNNIGIWCYMMLGIYVSYNPKDYWVVT